jgi:hypothetical protein
MSHPEAKSSPDLNVEDFKKYPVWVYTCNDAVDEAEVEPVTSLPAPNLSGMVVGLAVTLANGTSIWAAFSGLENNALQNEHLLSIALYKDGKQFHLSRYFDVDYKRRGPDYLARALNLPVDEVFPISYDARKLVQGEPSAYAGTITKVPRRRLSKDQIMDLIMGRPVSE